MSNDGLGSSLHPFITGANHPFISAAAHPFPSAASGFADGDLSALVGDALQSSRAAIVRDSDPSDAQPEALIKLATAPDDDALWRWSAEVRMQLYRFELTSRLMFDDGTIYFYEPIEDKSGAVLLQARELISFDLPKDGSGEAAAVLSLVLNAQAGKVAQATDRRADRAAEILAQKDTMWPFWTSVTNLRPELLPRTVELIAAAQDFATLVCMRIKHAVACPRPADVSSKVQPMIATPGHGSLPSGHATVAHLFARLAPMLLGLDGASTTATHLRRLARRIAENRVVAGVHFPLDSVAGELLGVTLADFFYTVCTGNATASAGSEFRVDAANAAQAGLAEPPRDDSGPEALPAMATLGKLDIGKGMQLPLLESLWNAAHKELEQRGLLRGA